jgi:hypothetical protein
MTTSGPEPATTVLIPQQPERHVINPHVLVSPSPRCPTMMGVISCLDGCASAGLRIQMTQQACSAGPAGDVGAWEEGWPEFSISVTYVRAI